jgi:hypothetical protein
MSQIVNCILLMLLGLILVSCSHTKTISREERRSDLLAAISLASETELFIDQLQEGRVTQTFAEVHIAYLHREASRSADRLRQAPADERMTGAIEKSRAHLDSLTTILVGRLRIIHMCALSQPFGVGQSLQPAK